MPIRPLLTHDFDGASRRDLTSFTSMFRRQQTRFAVFLLFVIAFSSVSLSAQKNAHHERKHLEREQIIALERAWRNAALADDVPAMDKLLSDDYLGITATGEVLTKTQQLDHMREKKLVINQIQTSQLKIKLIGHIAIVTSLAEVQGTSDGEPLRGAFRYTRVYQRMPSGSWKITSFEVTPTTRQHAAQDPD